METYAFERLMIERRHAVARAAEEHLRLQGWPVEARLAEVVAARLRSIADRLDPSAGASTVVSGSA
jgi:hypothetical protein